MECLYVLHTQYNLILGTGIAQNQRSSNHDLIVFKDFNVNEEIEDRLKNVYRKVLFLEGNYPQKEATAKEKFIRIASDNEQIEAFLQSRYDQVYIVDDMCIQEMYIMKCVRAKNPKAKLSWLEDGSSAYFDNGVVSSGMGATRFKRFVRKVFFSSLYHQGQFYDLATCMGGHKQIQEACICFPNQVRWELRKKQLRLVTHEEFISGMQQMYGGCLYNFDENSIVIALDKIDVYGDRISDVCEMIVNLIGKASRAQQKVYYKYHPREQQSLECLADCIELDRRIALESYLTNSSTADITVVGFKSTALQTAKKMGYNTISYIAQVEPDNIKVRDFYTEIGITCV